MIRARSSMTGRTKQAAQLRSVARAFPLLVGAVQFEECSIELEEMKRRTPVSTPDTALYYPGYLRDSGHLEGPVIEGSIISTEYVFDAWYAAIVHEDMDAFHAVGQAKFVESVHMESAAYMVGRICARIRLADLFNV